MRPRYSLAILLLLFSAYSCAELKIDDVADGPRDVIEDVDIDALIDIDDSETSPPDSVDTSDSETADFCPEDAESCEVGETRCGPDGRSLQSCNQVCNAYLPESTNPCGTGELCYETELGAACTAPPFSECNPLAASADVCIDSGSFAPCRRDGTLGSSTPCSANSRCANGVCRSPIIATGTACNNSGDCNSFCLCGSQDYNPRNAVQTECSLQPLLRGFCTVDDCLRDGCLDEETCALLSQTDFADGRNICLVSTSCAGMSEGDACMSAGRVGFTCRNVPVTGTTDGQIDWQLACYDALPTSVGETCRTSGECLGSDCKRRSTASVCSQACTSDLNCPADSVCVFNPDEIDVNDAETQNGLSSGLCLYRSTACDGTDDINASLTSRITRTFTDSANLLTVCYLAK